MHCNEVIKEEKLTGDISFPQQGSVHPSVRFALAVEKLNVPGNTLKVERTDNLIDSQTSAQ